MEVWKTIPNTNGFYEASSYGQIKSIDRFVQHNYGGLKKAWGRVLRQSKQRNGYLAVPICVLGKERRMNIHRLVALAFLGESTLQVNHIDGNKTNNHISNLEYCTSSDNLKHSFKLGLSSIKGERHPAAKFTNAQILEIRNKVQRGERITDIALAYHVAISTISNIKKGTNYASVY